MSAENCSVRSGKSLREIIMSRIGKKPIPLPKGVKVALEPPLIKVTGPKGNLSGKVPAEVAIIVEADKVLVNRPEDPKRGKSLQGLARTMIANMVKGVSAGFERVLEINGVGYRAELQGEILQFSLGFSHPIRFPLPAGLKAEVERQNRVTLRGMDKHLLGLTAAKIRKLRPPEPYGGKGIKYAEEVIHRKAGKTAVG
jgi:large subunit ribosomal protein L6